MLRRLLPASAVVAFALAVTMTASARQTGERAPADPSAKALIKQAQIDQAGLLRSYKTLTAELNNLATRKEKGGDVDREEAKRIRAALRHASDKLLEKKFDDVVSALNKPGADENLDILGDLNKLNKELVSELDVMRRLLETDSNSANREKLRKRAELLEQLKDLIAKQERIRAQTDMGRKKAEDLGKDQNKVTKETAETGGKKNKEELGGERKGEGKGDKGEARPDKAGEQKGGEQKPGPGDKAGEGRDNKGEGKGNEGKAEPKGGEGKPGEGKAGEGREGEGKEGKEAGKPGTGKGGDPKEGKGGEGKGGEGKEGKAGEGKGGEGKEGADKGGEGKAGEGKDGAGKEGMGKGGEGKPGEGKGAGKGGEGSPKAAEGKPGKGGEGKPGKGGEGKPGEGKGAGKGGEGKPGEGKQGGGEGKPGEGKPGEGKPGAAGKPGEGKPGGGKGAGKPGEGKPGEGKPGGGEPGKGGEAGSKGEAKPGDPKGGGKGGKPGESKGAGKGGKGKPGEGKKGGGGGGGGGGGDDDDELKEVKKKIEDANKYQKQAEIDLDRKKNNDASGNQGKAIEELEKAKKKLEELLKQQREEEIERILADLEKRCRYMLALQREVKEGTVSVDADIQKLPEKKADLVQSARSEKLKKKEEEIVREADAARKIIENEGSAIAFGEVFLQVKVDMENVANRLGKTDVGKVTQQIEDDIIATLTEMIEALQKAQKDAKQGPPKKGPPPPSGPPQDQKLIDQIAELKMIFAMQKRVNARTALYGKQYQGEQAPAALEGKDAVEREKLEMIQRELRDLSGRQQKIQKITKDIATGKAEAR